jgi:hypothetical protein
MRQEKREKKRGERFMLSLNEKKEILRSFDELSEIEDNLGRFFYYYDRSPSRKKIVARSLFHQ